VLRLVKNIIDSAHAAKIKVGMCGEMAGDPNFVLILMGLGLDEFSMPAQVIPEIKYVVRSVSFKDTQKIAQEAMKLSTAKEVEDYMHRKFKEIVK
jgi:phosphotransferase system enzyme I (PtsI)